VADVSYIPHRMVVDVSSRGASRWQEEQRVKGLPDQKHESSRVTTEITSAEKTTRNKRVSFEHVPGIRYSVFFSMSTKWILSCAASRNESNLP